MSLQKLIESYLDESSMAVTQGTLDTYQHAFSRFLKFVRSRPVDKELLVDWMTSMLRVDKLSPCSVRSYRTVIAGFYNWAEDMGHVKDSPMPRRFRIPSSPSNKIPIRLEDYVKDMTANSHDYVLMGLNLKTDEEYASAGG